MGPRPLGRGRRKDMGRPQIELVPSMGPRPLGRGRSRSRCIWTGGPSAVNGAATSRPRKADPASQIKKERARRQWGRDLSAAEGQVRRQPDQGRLVAVNGAATSRPRKVGLAPRWSRIAPTVNGAATSRPRKVVASFIRTKAPVVRQWGRDLSAAEGRRRRHARGQALHRQWGRDLSAAEGRPRRAG